MIRPLTTLAALLLANTSLRADVSGIVDQVDPTIGNHPLLLVPTRPTVSLPNSYIRVHPMRRDATDDRIDAFPLTLISHRLGELFSLLPGSDPKPQPYDQEITTPYYYKTRFDNSLITTEFTPTARTGTFRLTFPSGGGTLQLATRHKGSELSLNSPTTFAGVERFKDMAAYLYGEFDTPLIPTLSPNTNTNRLLLTAQDSDKKTITVRYAISFISFEQAKKNLEKENPTFAFDQLKEAAKAKWESTLSTIKIEGGTEAQKRSFYTALYRCYERMVLLTEDGQYYSAFDHQVHMDPRPFYTDNWLWDTYRALEPLHTLLHPEMEADKIQSYVRMYKQGGWMPSFAVLWGNYECMTGNPAAVWFADALAKGITNFDIQSAYEGVKKNSLEGTWLPWRRGPKTELDDFLTKNGYFPALHPDEKETVARAHPFERRQAISVTQAQSYDDWATAQLARHLGHNDDEQLFLKRAANYKNVFRTDKNEGGVWPKDKDGNWIEPFDPAFAGGKGGRDYTTENTALTYDWDVQHDLSGLFQLMGGNKAAEAKLDDLFRRPLPKSKQDFWATFPDHTGNVGQFSMGNEPSLHIPYLYTHLGSPWKTQKRVRMLLDTFFTDTLDGMPGDEDGGGMSAFVVFSMIGLYPTTPGLPTYTLTSPTFNKITLSLPNNKTFTINANNNSPQNKYITAISLNGQPLNRLWLKHSEITPGGTLTLTLSDTPNTTLGTTPDSLPPSSLTLNPNDFK